MNYCQNDQIKEDKKAGARSTRARDEKCE